MAKQLKTMSGYDCRNKWVFSFWRNVASDGADWTSTGRLFHSHTNFVCGDLWKLYARVYRHAKSQKKLVKVSNLKPVIATTWLLQCNCICWQYMTLIVEIQVTTLYKTYCIYTTEKSAKNFLKSLQFMGFPSPRLRTGTPSLQAPWTALHSL